MPEVLQKDPPRFEGKPTSRIVRDRHVVGGWSSGATPTW